MFFHDVRIKAQKTFRENNLLSSVFIFIYKTLRYVSRILTVQVRNFFYPPVHFLIYPVLYRFYSKAIKKISADTQLFFLTRRDLGTHLVLVDYVCSWQRVRTPTCIVIITSLFSRAKILASNICPNSKIICPDFGWLKIVVLLFGWINISSTFSKLNAQLQAEWPAALYIFLQPAGLSGFHKGPYIKELDKTIEHNKTKMSSQFVAAYTDVCKIMDYRYELYRDWIQLRNQENRGDYLVCVEEKTKKIKSLFNFHDRYVILNIAAKEYHSNFLLNRRGIYNPERYNSIIDKLISQHYTVVLQGRKEQPKFRQRKGLIDYARSSLCSVENDLALYAGASFCISSKSGPENFSTIFDIPLLGLEYVELISMIANPKFRFYPKQIRRKSTNRLITYAELLSSPFYFDIGANYYDEDIEYVSLREEELLLALAEFIPLATNSATDWMKYTPHQLGFREKLTPLHLDSFYIPGVPCDCYLQRSSEI